MVGLTPLTVFICICLQCVVCGCNGSLLVDLVCGVWVQWECVG